MSKEISVDTEEVISENAPIPNPNYPIQNPDSNLNPPQNGMSFSLDAIIDLEFFATYTNFDDPLFDVVTGDVFEDYAKNCVRNDFTKVSKKTLRRKIIDVYDKRKKGIKAMFSEFNRRLVVTCDLWSSFSGDDHFVSVICHWINDDWLLEKYVIGFDVLYKYDHVDIASKMIELLNEFNLKGKVGLISFDDAISKEKCMEHLVDEFDPLVKLLSHDRTFATAVDLCGQEVMDQVAPFLDPFRELIKWFRCNPEKKKEYRALCRSKGYRPTRFHLDSSDDWKCAYEDLSDLSRNKEILMTVYNGCPDHSPLLWSHWDDRIYALGMVEYFENVASRFSWPYDVNCHLVIHDCINIIHGLKEYEDEDPQFCSIARNIRSKWLELFPEIPTIYCLGTILDPRFKIEGLRQLLVYYYEALGVDYNVDEKVADCKNALRQLHAHYEPGSSSDEDDICLGFELDVFVKAMKRRRVNDQEFSGDLGEYLFFNFEFSADDKDQWFEITKWWEKKEELFPVLSKIVRDVLCTPMSTRIPKSDRCPEKRVLDEQRSRLPRELIPVCICKTDWDLTEDGHRGRDPDYRRLSSDSEAD
ncbi:hypothetical protein RND81_14G183400 [Saponaria officinalis]|uniref:HAT C-terminal dimerisation domain-containing protein n=1 Tax=Saponaria officinalis TaxID=3572 RepID=A0AAW1GVB5_SAPOF